MYTIQRTFCLKRSGLWFSVTKLHAYKWPGAASWQSGLQTPSFWGYRGWGPRAVARLGNEESSQRTLPQVECRARAGQDRSTWSFGLVFLLQGRDLYSVQGSEDVTVVGWIRDPQKMHIMISRSCEYVMWHSKRNSADVTELRTQRWGEEQGSPRWAQCHRKCPYRRAAEGRSDSRKGVSERCSMRKIQPATAGFEDGGRGHKPRNTSGLSKLEKARKQILQ